MGHAAPFCREGRPLLAQIGRMAFRALSPLIGPGQGLELVLTLLTMKFVYRHRAVD